MRNILETLVDRVRSMARATTLEPVSFLVTFSYMIVAAPEVDANIKLWKCCWYRLNYSREICDNILDDENKEYLEETQKSLNEFSIVLGYVQQSPMLIYALIVGSLADDFGRKILLIIPSVGRVIGSTCAIINLAFIESLPFEFYFYEISYFILGGDPVFYLAYYAYGSSASSAEDRTKRLTRYDAFNELGLVLGALLGPIIFRKFGYYSLMSIKLIGHIIIVLYIWLLVKEVVPKQSSGIHGISCKAPWQLLKRYLLIPLYEMGKAVVKKREKNLQWLLYILLFAYSIYWFCIPDEILLYFYATVKLDNFDGIDFAHLNVVFRSLSCLTGLVVLPILSGKLRLHDSFILIIIEVSVVIASISIAFVTQTWQFWVSVCLLFLRISQFGTARSLITKCLHPNEYGKIFSVIAFSTALMPLISNPIYRSLYNTTVDTFPGAIYILTASLYSLTILVYIIVYSMRQYLLVDSDGDVINAIDEVLKEEEIITSVQDRRTSVLLTNTDHHALSNGNSAVTLIAEKYDIEKF